MLFSQCSWLFCAVDSDLLTVSETSNEPPAEEGINSPRNLALEATFINHNFSQQVLKMVSLTHFLPPSMDILMASLKEPIYAYRVKKYRHPLSPIFVTLAGRREAETGGAQSVPVRRRGRRGGVGSLPLPQVGPGRRRRPGGSLRARRRYHRLEL